jgi:hypothetical protein
MKFNTTSKTFNTDITTSEIIIHFEYVNTNKELSQYVAINNIIPAVAGNFRERTKIPQCTAIASKKIKKIIHVLDGKVSNPSITFLSVPFIITHFLGDMLINTHPIITLIAIA